MKVLVQKLRDCFELELENSFLWAPVFLGLGILCYFHLPFDPSFLQTGVLLFASIAGLMLCWRNYYFRYIAAAFLLFAVGFGASDFRTHYVAAPKLKVEKKDIWVEGKIDEIIFYDKGKKLVLSEVDSLDLMSDEIPAKIRVNIKSNINDFLIGDRILVKATLMPPPKPNYPGGFEFERFLYFKQIGAIGYAVNKPRLLELADSITMRDRVNSMRKKIADRIENIMDYPANAVAIAMLVCDTSRIKSTEFEQIRKSGIAHLIAISGLHIVTVVALIFLLVRFLLTRSPTLSNRYNSKKVAAIASILCTSVYLLISGAPVSAQRAFIMSCIVLVAIIADRRSSPMRSIAISAMMILLVTPETLLSASLQMSFTACIALVTAFHYLKGVFVRQTDSVPKKAFGYFLGVSFSTLIAGTATAPLIVYHFNQFSTYSLLANLICVPLSDFVIMPFGILMLVLMPIGLDFIPAFFIEKGLNIVVQSAAFVSELPYSSFFIPSFPDYGIFLIIAGFLIFCFMQSRIKLIGIPILIIGLLTQLSFSPPDILIDNQAKLFAYWDKTNHMYLSSKQKSRFSAKSWQATLGANKVDHVRKLQSCTDAKCTLEISGKKISIGKEIICDNSADFLINTSEKNLVCANTKVVNWGDIKPNGASIIWINSDDLTIATVGENLLRRLWNN